MQNIDEIQKRQEALEKNINKQHIMNTNNNNNETVKQMKQVLKFYMETMFNTMAEAFLSKIASYFQQLQKIQEKLTLKIKERISVYRQVQKSIQKVGEYVDALQMSILLQGKQDNKNIKKCTQKVGIDQEPFSIEKTSLINNKQKWKPKMSINSISISKLQEKQPISKLITEHNQNLQIKSKNSNSFSFRKSFNKPNKPSVLLFQSFQPQNTQESPTRYFVQNINWNVNENAKQNKNIINLGRNSQNTFNKPYVKRQKEQSKSQERIVKHKVLNKSHSQNQNNAHLENKVSPMRIINRLNKPIYQRQQQYKQLINKQRESNKINFIKFSINKHQDFEQKPKILTNFNFFNRA